jgi:hypothetical protein
MDNGMVLLSESSDWVDVLASGMTGSGGDLAKVYFKSCCSMDVVSLSAILELSLSQSKAYLTSPLMEMTPRSLGIFRTT